MGLGLGETPSYLRGATCHVGTGPKRPQDTAGHSGHTSGRATLLTPMRSKSSKSPRLGASEGLDAAGTRLNQDLHLTWPSAQTKELTILWPGSVDGLPEMSDHFAASLPR